MHIFTAQYNASLLVSQLIGLQQKAQRLMREQSDSINKLWMCKPRKMTPTSASTKNDAVLNAERAFEEALQEASTASR
ncbi:MAG: hypothetical protein H6728_01580 [Myxococcales bacterium]|nr:hypothetical protein [Myxococcales bacterium]